jgi:hypothetical protein
MNEQNGLPQAHAYDVQVGFARVRVEGDTPAEAIRNARRQLCLELPRMYDVISTMADQRFVVEQVMR